MTEPDRFDPETIQDLALLARLELEPERQQALAGHLQAILGWVAELEAIDTEGVSASAHQRVLTPDQLRPDATRPSLEREAALKNAPARDPLGFLVPRVVSE